MGMDPRPPLSPEARELILTRFFRLVIVMLLRRAWAQKSKGWLSFAGLVVLWKFLDGLSARAGQRAAKNRST